MAESNSTRYGVIYLITHRASGKMYIGQTVRPLSWRWHEHQTSSYCALLHRAIKKYGAEAFSVFELDESTTKGGLDEREIFWMDFLGTRNRRLGYNLRGGGASGKHSDESRKKMSVAIRKAYERPDLRESRRKHLAVMIQKPEYRQRISDGLRGLSPNDATRKKMSETRKALWSDPEYRERVKAAQLAGKQKAEFKRKQSEKAIQNWQDPEKRAKFMAALAASRNDPIKEAARVAKGRITRALKKMHKEQLPLF